MSDECQCQLCADIDLLPPSTLTIDENIIEVQNAMFIDGLTSEQRKQLPLVTGCLDYFPLALLYVSKVSKIGNDKHNPGEPLHWARGKSMDQADTIGRHLLTRKIKGSDGVLHAGNLAWRALADLQLLIEELIAKGENPFA